MRANTEERDDQLEVADSLISTSTLPNNTSQAFKISSICPAVAPSKWIPQVQTTVPPVRKAMASANLFAGTSSLWPMRFRTEVVTPVPAPVRLGRAWERTAQPTCPWA